MSNKSKREKQHPPANPNQKGSDEKSSNRHVYIEPGAKIDFVDDLRNKYEASQREDKTHQSKQLFWTKIAAGLLVLTAGFTAWQGYMAQRTFNASERPYVGVSGVTTKYEHVVNGTTEQINSPTPDTTAMDFWVEIKNFGPVPGPNFDPSWELTLDGKDMPDIKIPDVPSTIYPGQLDTMSGHIGGKTYQDIDESRSIFRIEATVKYTALGKTQHECTVLQYNPITTAFFNLGECKTHHN